MINFKKIFSVLCLSTIINSGKSDAKITPYIDGIKELLIGAVLCFGGYKVKGSSEEVKKGLDKNKSEIDKVRQVNPYFDSFCKEWIDGDNPKFIEIPNTCGNVLLGVGAFEGGLGLIRIFEELI